MSKTYADITLADLPGQKHPKLSQPGALQSWATFGGRWGLSYHKCRFCKRGLGEVPGLWKYGVRHRICERCFKHQTGKDAPARPA